MFVGQYDFNGEPEQLLAAYDRFMSLVPSTSVFFHVCLRREAGISIIDACPTTEDFAETIADPDCVP